MKRWKKGKWWNNVVDNEKTEGFRPKGSEFFYRNAGGDPKEPALFNHHKFEQVHGVDAWAVFTDYLITSRGLTPEEKVQHHGLHALNRKFQKKCRY